MFSAGDSSGDGLSGLNQFAAMSGPIDWAAMAQQWIQMHDTGNFISMPDAPPPPNISSTIHAMKSCGPKTLTTTTTAKKSFEEKGEADMDMDEDEENAKGRETPPPPAPSMRLGKSKEEINIQSQPWYMRQQNPVVSPPVTESFTGIDIDNNMSQVNTAAPQWGATVWPPQINLPPPTAGSILNVPLNTSTQNPASHIPSLMKISVPNPNAARILTPNIEEQTSDASAVDAKKRKMLPAWIREGLEKMEREKQRQLEKEQRKKPGCTDSTSSFSGFVGTANIPAHTVNMKYNQYAENDRSGNEDEVETDDLDGVAIGDGKSKLRQKKTYEDDGSGISEPEYETDNENKIEPRTHMGNRSYEDRLSDLMTVVRTTLTELLLEVTNQEIANMAQEAVNAHKAKASSAQVIRKSALSSITGKLGLAAYDDSTGDEISDSDGEAYADSDKNNDSEEEIKASIRTKRRAFAKVTDEIEERIAANAAREEQKLKYYSMLEKQGQDQEQEQDSEAAAGEFSGNDNNPSTIMASSSALTSTVSKPYERDFGETTETKLQNSNGKRQKDRNSRKERTTRFSDNKDSKGAAAVAANYISKMHNSNLSGNTSGTALFPISATATTISSGMTIGSSPSIVTPSHDSSHITHNISKAAIVDDNHSVNALNKNLLHAAEAAFENATKSRRATSSRSSVSRSERDRSYRSSHYDHKDHKSDRYRESVYERDRERKRDRDDERVHRDRKRERDSGNDSHARRHKSEHASDDDDTVGYDVKDKSRESSSDTDTSSSSSTSSSTSHHSSHYSRTSTTSKQRHGHEYNRRERRDEHKERDRRSERSRSQSRRRHYHNQHSSSYRYSSAEDDYDNDSRYRHSSSRRDSSRKRSRSRSRSTYSSSSHRRRH